MRERRATARETLAANMEYLRTRERGDGEGGYLSHREIARRAGVSAGTVDTMFHTQGSSPGLDKVELVAAAFRLRAWQLLMPELPAMLAHVGEVSRLLSQYVNTDEAGRKALYEVSQRLGNHKDHS